jgi:mycofactocin precursor
MLASFAWTQGEPMSDHIMTAENTAEVTGSQGTATAGSTTGPAGASAAAPAAGPAQPSVTVTDVLVEEVSIDGMCGVY